MVGVEEIQDERRHAKKESLPEDRPFQPIEGTAVRSSFYPLAVPI
jgi:hypothetical protein